MVSVEGVSDDSGGSVFAVSCAEGVVDVDVSVGCQSGSELFLTFFHCLLCFVIGGVSLVDADGFAFLFGVEAEVFEQKHIAALQRCGSVSSFCTVGSELHFHTEFFAHGVHDLAERELGVHFAFGFSHVAHDDECAAVCKHFLEGGQCATDAGVIGDFSVLV